MTSYGKVKVKRNKPGLDEVPDDCGYMQRFEFNVDMNSNGIMGECIDWCQQNCEGRWGWWYETTKAWETHWDSSGNRAYMSFGRQEEALKFWFANVNLIYDTDYGKN